MYHPNKLNEISKANIRVPIAFIPLKSLPPLHDKFHLAQFPFRPHQWFVLIWLFIRATTMWCIEMHQLELEDHVQLFRHREDEWSELIRGISEGCFADCHEIMLYR